MKTTIYKYPLQVKDIQHVSLPDGAKILCVQTQHNQICLWAEVDPEKPVPRSTVIEMFGTGQPHHWDMGIDRRYLGTCQLEGGSLVFHVYEYTGV